MKESHDAIAQGCGAALAIEKGIGAGIAEEMRHGCRYKKPQRPHECGHNSEEPDECYQPGCHVGCRLRHGTVALQQRGGNACDADGCKQNGVNEPVGAAVEYRQCNGIERADVEGQRGDDHDTYWKPGALTQGQDQCHGITQCGRAGQTVDEWIVAGRAGQTSQ